MASCSEEVSRVEVAIPARRGSLEGELAMPADARGIAIFAHGSGSSRRSPRNRYVADVLHQAGIGTLLFDLLPADEEAVDLRTGELRFDIAFLAGKLRRVTEWLSERKEAARQRIGYFGASTGAAAALVAATQLSGGIGAIVCRGGRPDLAGDALEHVRAPTLLIVGEHDETVLDLNRDAYGRLGCEKQFRIIPDATHLFEEPGTLQEVAALAAEFLQRHLHPGQIVFGTGSIPPK